MSSIQERFERALAGLGPAPVTAVIAVSGGPDSIALLDLVATVGKGLGLAPLVAHFDHGIHPESADIANRVAAAAARYGFPFRTHRIELGPGATETVARRARVAWLEQVAEEHGAAFIVTGHHRDDQVETMIMRFLNGSGPAGLAGIGGHRGRWVRPLLDITRHEIGAYLAARALASWQDPSNADQRQLRSWVRHELLPRIEQGVPRVRENLRAARGVFEENRRGWDDLLGHLPALDLWSDDDGISVAVAPLRGYSSALVRSLLRALGFRLGAGLGKGQVDRLQRLILQGHTGQAVDLVGGGRGELAFDRLKLFRGAAHRTEYEVPVAGEVAAADIGAWRLTSTHGVPPDVIPRDGFVTWVTPDASLVVRPWRPGDRIRPIRGRGSRLVVRCMQDKRIPWSLRPKWPVFEHLGVVIWVPGVCRSDVLLPDPTALAMRVDVSPR